MFVVLRMTNAKYQQHGFKQFKTCRHGNQSIGHRMFKMQVT